MSRSSIEKFKDVIDTDTTPLALSKVIEHINPDENTFSSLVIVSCNACNKMGLDSLLKRWSNTHVYRQPKSMRGLANIYRTFGFKETLPWIQAGVNIQSIDSSGRSLPSYLITDHKIDYLTTLLPHWNTPRVQGICNGKPILYSSGLYWAQSEEMVNWLVEHGANPNEPSLSLDTKDQAWRAYPLTNALYLSSVDRVRWLLKAGADPQIAEPWISKYLEGPDHERLQHLTMTSYVLESLTEYGYDWSVPSKNGHSSQLKLLQKSWISQHVKDLAQSSYEKNHLDKILKSAKVKTSKYL